MSLCAVHWLRHLVVFYLKKICAADLESVEKMHECVCHKPNHELQSVAALVLCLHLFCADLMALEIAAL